MTRGLLLRHASTDWNEAKLWQGGEIDRPLSPSGIAAAESVSREVLSLFGRRPAVIASPLVRAVQTAHLIVGDGPIDLRSSLREMVAGPLAGMRADEIESRWPEFWSQWSAGEFITPPGGEDRDSVLDRVTKAKEDLEGLTSDWVAVTHLGVIRAVERLSGVELDSPEENLSGLRYENGVWQPWQPSSETRAPRSRVAIGADQLGMVLLAPIKDWAKVRGYEVIYPNPSEEASDYPMIAQSVANAVADGRAEMGVLACGTGIGMAIAANKVRGIRAAAVSSIREAAGAAGSNDANVLCLGGEIVTPQIARDLLDVWTDTPFRAGNSVRKVKAISVIEDKRR